MYAIQYEKSWKKAVRYVQKNDTDNVYSGLSESTLRCTYISNNSYI